MKRFNKTCREKKSKFWIEETKKLNELRNDNAFWKKWKSFGEDIKTQKRHPGSKDGGKWESFFKKLYTAKTGDINSTLKKINQPINAMLNTKADLKELKLVIAGLKTDKAVGLDRIANEFLN